MRCAVHYVETDDGFRYCVRPEGEPLELPPRPETSVEDWVEHQQWARALSGPVRLPNGETAQAARPITYQIDSTWGKSSETTVTGEVDQTMHV